MTTTPPAGGLSALTAQEIAALPVGTAITVQTANSTYHLIVRANAELRLRKVGVRTKAQRGSLLAGVAVGKEMRFTHLPVESTNNPHCPDEVRFVVTCTSEVRAITVRRMGVVKDDE